MDNMSEKLALSTSHSRSLILSLAVLAGATAIAAASYLPPFDKWVRLSPNPIVSPQGNGFESAGTFNPSVVMKDGKFVMLYRAQDRKGTSSLHWRS